MLFQNLVITIATILLIISLCIIGFGLYRQKYNSNYPPVIPNCPDYWDVSGNICINDKGLGNSNCQEPMDFTKPQWSGNNGLCAKYDWSKMCNIAWDGISNNHDIC